ncbi:hypothetical protein F8M41_009890 [Gigaspora margarita]|uniref:Uncharacterized protein n=1 Tax=Gigaspora margarita TaxID=4874 RepID=A0A8H3X360_GIGMA|nr:hypothetical protein F8M41_009890 [Gigaspora margarita]
MEELLNDTQIVETVLAEELEREQGVSEDSDEEPPKISASEGNNDDFSDNGNDSEFDDIYSSDNLPNDDSLPEYDFPEYDNFSNNYGGPSDDYEI